VSLTKVKKLNREKLDAINKLKEEYQQKMRNEGEDVVKSMLKEFFENNPLIEGVRWHQYTPGFNDGDPCTFSVTEPAFRFSDVTPNFLRENLESYYVENPGYAEVREEGWNGRTYLNKKQVGSTPMTDEEVMGLLEEGGESEDGYFEVYGLKNSSPYYESCQELSGLIEDSEDILELIFGDNVTVEVTRDGIETEGYDCGY